MCELKQSIFIDIYNNRQKIGYSLILTIDTIIYFVHSDQIMCSLLDQIFSYDKNTIQNEFDY